MRKIQFYKAGKTEANAFVPHSFNQNEATLSTIEILEALRAKNNKRTIRKIAQREGLVYDKEKIGFTKKIISILVNEISDGE